MKLMYIKFLDHCAGCDAEWKETDELDPKMPEIEVVGFLAKEDENSYTLVQANEGTSYSNFFSIIKSTVIKKKFFKIPK